MRRPLPPRCPHGAPAGCGRRWWQLRACSGGPAPPWRHWGLGSFVPAVPGQSCDLCDADIISALPDNIFSDGMAEVIKYGAIKNAHILDLAAENPRENLRELIAECVKIKRDVVMEDEFDKGARQLLNFGHTPAHAIEKLGALRISHGSAVAAGMCIMARAAERMKLCPCGISDELVKLCKKYSLPTTTVFSARELAAVSMSDKKRAEGKITLVVPSLRGECVLMKTEESELERIFALGLSEE